MVQEDYAENVFASTAAALRRVHVREQFGDCVEDGQRFPCRTLQVLAIAAAHLSPGETETVVDVVDGELAVPEDIAQAFAALDAAAAAAGESPA